MGKMLTIMMLGIGTPHTLILIKSQRLSLLFGLLVLCQAQSLLALPRCTIDAGLKSERIGAHFEYFQSMDAPLTLDQVTQLAPQRWRSIHSPSPSFGYSKVPYWFRTELYNNSDATLSLALKLRAPNIDYLDFYFFNADGSTRHLQLGDQKKHRERPVAAPGFIVPLTLAADERTILYIKMESQGSIDLPISLWQQDELAIQQQSFVIAQGIFFGLLLAMAIYNISLYIGMRSREYLYFSLTIFFGSIFQAAYSGIGFQFLWPEFPLVNNYAIPLSIVLFYISATVLANSILQVKKLAPHLSPYMLSFTTAIIAVGILSLFLSYSQSVKLVSTFGAIGGIGLLVLGVYLVAIGNKKLVYFVVFWAVLCLGIVLLIASSNGIANRGFWVEYIVEFGAALIVLATSSSLSNNFNRERRSKMRAQHRALRHQRLANREQERYLNLRLARQTEELEAQKRINEAETSNRAKSQFLANISHEIRTPLNGILGITQLLQDSVVNQQQKHYVNIINNSSKTLLRLINDLLDYSKISSGKMDVEHIPVNISELCRRTLSDFEAGSGDKGLKIQLVQNIDSTLWIKSDPTRLSQILNNLLSNAYKFTHQGFIELRISQYPTGSTEQTDGSLLIEVVDSGIGIAEDVQQQLFQSFAQADTSTTRQYGGTGLGLSICKQLVALLGGEIGVESSTGKGSRFWFTLPYQRFEVAETSKNNLIQTQANNLFEPIFPPSEKLLTNPNSDLQAAHTHYKPALALQWNNLSHGKSVLVAEDNPVNQIVISGLLKKLDLSFTLCSTGSEAIKAFQNFPDKFCCILMDCEMPDTDGFEATKAIRNFETEHQLSPLPVIAVTAHSRDEYRERLDQAGFSDHLSKPISFDQLKQKLIDSIEISDPA